MLVMVEHFSKWIELIALPQNSSKLAATSFLDCVLARFGASTEVITEQKREFLGSFEELCMQALIDHRTTSRDHPEVDGLAKKGSSDREARVAQVWTVPRQSSRLGFQNVLDSHGISL